VHATAKGKQEIGGSGRTLSSGIAKSAIPCKIQVLAVVSALVLVGVTAGYSYRTVMLVLDDEFDSRARKLIERSQRLAEAASNYHERATLDALGPNLKNGEYYRFDERVADARVSAVSVSAPTEDTIRIEFDGDDSVELTSVGGTPRLEAGLLKLDCKQRDYLITQGPITIDPDAIAEVEIRIRQEKGRKFELAWSRDVLAEWPELKDEQAVKKIGSIEVDTIASGQFHSYLVDATRLGRRIPPGHRIRTFFLRPCKNSHDRIEIDYVRFVSKREKYRSTVPGRSHETYGNEARSVLYTSSPATLTYDVMVPGREPRLSFGMGVLEQDHPVRFSVLVSSNGRAAEAFSTIVRSNDRWYEGGVDFSPWAGQRVEVTLRTESNEGNIAFWSNPTLFGRPKERFNVIVVLEDALRADRLSTYGHHRETSPIKSRLAENGVIFEHGFAQAPTTRRSCPSLMTSLYPDATGVRSHVEVLDDAYLTLAEVMRSQGYETASFIQNSNAGPAAGLHQGFSFVFERGVIGDKPWQLYEEASCWLGENAQRNFFIYLHVIDPHRPYEPLPPFDRWYREEGPGTTPAAPTREQYDPPWVEKPTVEGRRLLYDGEVRQNDYWLGKFIEELERLKIRDTTLLIIIADHGEHLGEHGLWGHDAPGYIQVLRVPLILVHPTRVPSGVRITAPVQLLDLMPTVLELSGVETSKLLLQGDSLVSLIRGGRTDAWASRIALSEEPRRAFDRVDSSVSASVFFRNWHLLRSWKLPALKVFDYVQDPQEKQPIEALIPRLFLAQRVDALLRAMKEANIRLWRAIARDSSSEVIRYDPAVRERLRALGYFEED
jgi:arylsulfatase